jgi:hypothetical protein
MDEIACHYTKVFNLSGVFRDGTLLSSRRSPSLQKAGVPGPWTFRYLSNAIR